MEVDEKVPEILSEPKSEKIQLESKIEIKAEIIKSEQAEALKIESPEKFDNRSWNSISKIEPETVAKNEKFPPKFLKQEDPEEKPLSGSPRQNVSPSYKSESEKAIKIENIKKIKDEKVQILKREPFSDLA